MTFHYKNNIMFFTLLLTLVSSTSASLMYDSFTGNALSPKEQKDYIKRNITFWCANEFNPCDPYEGRRIDGSCNNLKHPSRGASHTPLYHILPLEFDDYHNPRKSQSGKELPLSRRVRTSLLLEGRVPDQQITHLLTYFWVFMSSDVLSFHDTVNYLSRKIPCCDERSKSDPECINVVIPDDDPVHRFSGERCANLTRPYTFQSTGCIGKNYPPERTITATSTFDLSQIYGDDIETFLSKKRLFKGGLLKYELFNGQVWPPTLKDPKKVCVANVLPRETRCHDVGDDSNNGVLGMNLFAIWMWRNHNYIANKLAKINPCWDDEKLFYTAREINIAITMQIFFYELHPTLLGYQNLVQEGVLSPSLGYRDIHNEDVIPQVSLEYGFSLRWAHTIQGGIVKMFDFDGSYKQSIRITDLTLRTGYLAVDNNLDYITQGAFRQATGKIDNAVDPVVSEAGLGPLLRVADITSSDLTKNRFLGLAPYIKYRKFCFGEIIKTFDDLQQAIDPEKIELLKELYEDVNDIDLLAGIWVERPISNGRVPATFYCLTVDQLQRSIISDRHWYERPNRPNAFTIDQLNEIRKANMARLICDVGDQVTQIQPRAFIIPGPGNELTSCNEIQGVDLRAWKDSRCPPSY